jgi:hypothetical protein
LRPKARSIRRPDCSLRQAFWSDLARAVTAAESNGGCLTVATLRIRGNRHRLHLDTARLFSPPIRDIDFACQEQDGSIVAAVTEVDLRIASVLRHTMPDAGAWQ